MKQTHHELESTFLRIFAVHFEGAPKAQIASMASGLADNVLTAIGYERLEYMDRLPHKDHDDIRKAAMLLEQAAKLLGGVGWHGGKALVQVANAYVGSKIADGSSYPLDNTDSQETLASHLQKLSDQLGKARHEVNKSALPLKSAFGDGPEFDEYSSAKKRKIAAKWIAQDCAETFFGLTGRFPTVSTDSINEPHKAYGPFLDFVADIFTAANISASAERFARSAAKDFSP